VFFTTMMIGSLKRTAMTPCALPPVSSVSLVVRSRVALTVMA